MSRTGVKEQAAVEGGTGASFDFVFAQEQEALIRLAVLFVGSSAMAEELVQDTFVRLFERFDQIANPQGFLRTALVRLCLTSKRRSSMERERLAVGSFPEPTGIPDVDELWDLVIRLERDRRVALVLRFYEDWSYEQIASAMNCRVSTARTRVHRGLAELRKELDR